MNVLELSDRLWRGEIEVAGPPGFDQDAGRDENPFLPRNELVEIGEGTAFVSSFANVTSFRTGDGLVNVDSGAPFSAGEIHRMS